MAHRVIAPFVMLKVKDAATGAYTFQGLYEGAVVEDVDPDNLRHHLDLGMVEEVGAAAEPEPSDKASDKDQPAAKGSKA